LLTYPRRMSVILNKKKKGSQKAIMYIIKHIVNSIDFPLRSQSENTSVTRGSVITKYRGYCTIAASSPTPIDVTFQIVLVFAQTMNLIYL